MNYQQNYEVHGAVIRTPLLSSKYYQKIDSKIIKELFQQRKIREAIVLTSPDFLEEIDKWIDGDIKDEKKCNSILYTAYKYISRLSSRATPFGLFSNVNYLNISQNEQQNNNLLSEKTTVYSRLDLSTIKLIVAQIVNQTSFKKNISYQANNSLFIVGDSYRYYESSNGEKNIDFTISKVDRHEVLETIINYCEELRTIDQIVKHTTTIHSDYDKGSIHEFINELVDEKIICSHLESIYTNSSPLEYLIFLLETEGSKTDKALQFYILKLNTIKEYLSSDLTISEQFEKIYFELKELGVSPNRKDILHVDSSKENRIPITLNFNQKERESILKIKDLLAGFIPNEKDRFHQFKKRFSARYGDNKMPLLFVLDPEFGLGYKEYSENLDVNPLQKGIPIKQNETNQVTTFSKSEILLLNLVIESQTSGKNKIDLKANESIFPLKEKYMNTSFSIFMNALGDDQYYLDSFTSCSAGRLLNRFAHIDPNLKNLCKSIIDFESEPDKIKAEIRHLFDYKTESIFKSNNLHQYELPCISSATGKKSEKIKLSNLFISIKNNRLVLTSSKHSKEIVPMLSEAKSYQNNSIDLFKFLADFQFQNNRSFLTFNWSGLLNVFNKFPRLIYDNFIISPQLWILTKKEVKSEKELFNWRIKNKIPEKIYSTTTYNSDSKVLINFQDAIGVNTMLKELSKNGKLFLTEILIKENTPFKDKEGHPFHNEVIIPFLNPKHQIESKNNLVSKDNNKAETIYYPGDKWVYFKVYCNHIAVDNLLKNDIQPFVDDLINRSLISCAFFVRYYDDDFHLRIRFLLKDVSTFSTIVQEFHSILSPYRSNQIIHSITIDTYKKEIDRYGIRTMDLCEQVFFQDSLAVMAFLSFAKEENSIVFAIKGINHYLNDFKFNLSEKLKILENLTNAFFYEFKIDKNAKKSMDKKYRSYRALFFTSLYKKELNNENDELLKIHDILSNRSKKIEKNIAAIKYETNDQNNEIDICTSLIHMFLNRLFRGNHRKQEMILYYFLYKHFESVQAIEKKNLN